MLKICILCVSGLPIPAVKGGAIETLVQELIDQNEKEKKYQFYVLTMKDNNTAMLQSKYNYTKFICFKNRIIYRIYMKLRKQIDKVITLKHKLTPVAKWDMINYVKKNVDEFDYFIAEAGMEDFVELDKIIPYEKRIYHLHGEADYNILHGSYAKYVFSVSKFCKEEWIEHVRQQSSEKNERGLYVQSNEYEKNVYLFPNCININHFKQSITSSEKKDMRNKLGIKESDFVLIFVGRLIKEKGVLELIKAIKECKKEDIKLLIVGGVYFSDNRVDDYYHQLIKSAEKIKNQVKFLGYIPNNQIWKYQKISNVTLVPSICNEAAGLVVLEGQASGNPVICTDVGGIPENLGAKCGILIKNDKSLVFSLRDAILKLYNNRELCVEYAVNAKKWCEKFSQEQYYIYFDNIMKDIENRINYKANRHG